MKLQDRDLVAAVEQACREESFGLAALSDHITSDDAGCRNWGGLTPRIARILGVSEQLARRRLASLHKKDIVKRHQHRAGGTIRWWPTGLIDRVSAEPQVSSTAN